jgi:hypothetical protein
MPFLQAGVFKHPIVGKGRLEGDGHLKKWLISGNKGDRGHMVDIIGKVIGVG